MSIIPHKEFFKWPHSNAALLALPFLFRRYLSSRGNGNNSWNSKRRERYYGHGFKGFTWTAFCCSITLPRTQGSVKSQSSNFVSLFTISRPGRFPRTSLQKTEKMASLPCQKLTWNTSHKPGSSMGKQALALTTILLAGQHPVWALHSFRMTIQF